MKPLAPPPSHRLDHLLPLLLCGLLLLVLGVLNAAWIGTSTLFTGQDLREHMRNLHRLSELLQAPGVTLHALLNIDKDYPPLLYWSLYLWGQLAGGLELSRIVAASSLFFGLLVLLVFAIGRKLADGWTGLLAAALIAASPAFLFRSREIGIDLPFTAILLLSLLFLYLSDSFRNKRYSLLFGIAVGLCLLLNQKTHIYLMGPLLFEGGIWVRETIAPLIRTRSWRPAGKALIPALLCFIPAFLLASPYYLPILFQTTTEISNYAHRWNLFEGELYYRSIPVTYLRIVTFYLDGVFRYALAPLPALITLLGALASLAAWRTRAAKRLMIWFLVPVLCLTYFNCKYFRYALPIVPALVLLAALGIMRLRHRTVRISVAIGVLGLCLTLAAALSFPLASLATPRATKIVGEGQPPATIELELPALLPILRVHESQLRSFGVLHNDDTPPVTTPYAFLAAVERGIFFPDTIQVWNPGYPIGATKRFLELLELDLVAVNTPLPHRPPASRRGGMEKASLLQSVAGNAVFDFEGVPREELTELARAASKRFVTAYTLHLARDRLLLIFISRQALARPLLPRSFNVPPGG